MKRWRLLSETTRLRSRWLTLIGERWRDARDQEVDYWRVEKADSVIIVPTQAKSILCCQEQFRPGIQRAALDFPGGRLVEGKKPADMVPEILQRELQVPPDTIRSVEAVNTTQWNINSSFSNQGLWVFHAAIDEHFHIPDYAVGMRVPLNTSGVDQLLRELDCLQCRAALLEWRYAKGSL